MNDKPTALYRHFAADGSLLYVGISLSPLARLSQHRDSSPWYGEIARVEVEWHPNREAALAAEKAAIQAEGPRHNVIHARFGRPVVEEEDALVEISWPMPAKYALIAWDFEDSGREAGAVAVGYQPYRVGCGDWSEHYHCTSGAAYTRWRDMSSAELRSAILVEFFMLTTVYEIDPRVVSQAFLNIQEFRDAIEAGMLGPNLLGADLPYIAKSDPRPEHRFWHSVHVFPRDVRLINAA